MTLKILRSSSSGSRNRTPLRSEISQRTCAGGECGTGRNSVEAHIVQIVDKPNQIFALQAWSDISILIPAEKFDELVAKMRQSPFEIAEFL